MYILTFIPDMVQDLVAQRMVGSEERGRGSTLCTGMEVGALELYYDPHHEPLQIACARGRMRVRVRVSGYIDGNDTVFVYLCEYVYGHLYVCMYTWVCLCVYAYD